MILHASCVAHGGRGLLILGPSGAGKSGLALQLMALGAALVADDRTSLWLGPDNALWAGAPPGLPPLIEARFVGLLRVPEPSPPVPLALAADLGQTETQRLPPERRLSLLGQSLPLVFHAAGAHFPSALLHYLTHGRES
ncbi:MAG: HPr kinase/phosphorylase [Paracoccaceae bacterium]